MQPPSARTARDPQVVQTTIGLIRYLRDLVNAGKRTVRDCMAYQNCWWLADLPEGVKRLDERNGAILLEVAFEPRRPPPEPPDVLAGRIDRRHLTDPERPPSLLDPAPANPEPDIPAISSTSETLAYEKWLASWQQWADTELRARPHRELHRDLADAARRLSQHDDTLEAVLGLGLLCMDLPGREPIRRHLITLRVDLSIDRSTTMITVAIPEEAVPRSEDRQFLNAQDGFVAERVESLWQELHRHPLHPLSEEMVAILEKWQTRALEEGARFTGEWQAPEAREGETVIALAPALILRQRDANLLAENYEKILESLESPDASAPLGLAQLVFGLEKAERIAWRTRSGGRADLLLGEEPLFPLPANTAQRSVLQRLQSDTAVVVQGPPGTGKTHTIANLLAALLASGKRVLVTSAKDQALSVVRAMLPEPLRELCVQYSHQYSRGADELERTITALSDRVCSSDPRQLRQDIAQLRQQRAQALSRHARVQNEIFTLRESETVRFTVSSRYAGTRADIVDSVRSNADRFAWIAPLPESAQAPPPLTPSAAMELAGLLKGATPARLRLRHAFLPDISDLISPAEFAALTTAVAAQNAIMPSPLGEQLGRLTPERVHAIELCTRQALNAQHRLGIAQQAMRWDESDWRARALRDVLAERDQALWQHLHQVARQAVEHQQELASLGLRQVTIPDLPRGKVAAMARACMELCEHLVDEGKSRRLMRPRAVRDAERLLAGCAVDGESPRTYDQADALLVHLRAHEVAEALDMHWQHAGLQPTSGPLPVRLSELCDRATQLASIREFSAAVQHIGAALRGSGLRHPLNTPQGWDELLDNIEWGRSQAAANQAAADLEALELTMAPAMAEVGPEARALRDAVRSRDVHAYEQAVNRLAEAIRHRAEQERCDELMETLRLTHPRLATAISDAPADPVWSDRLADLSQAWEWGLADAFCRGLSTPGRDQELMSALEDAERAVETVTAELAAAEAWMRCLSRMTQDQRMGLQSYKNRMSDYGKGTSKRYGERRRLAIRDAMSIAQEAVPAWIMPLPLVVETIRPQPDCFDVVIVDEASQLRVDSAFLLWLAPHVIVVGDDQQCAPGAIQYGELQPIHDQIDRYMPDVRPAFRDDIAPTSNLYALLSARFPDVVRLSDHYRCMPEIIGWSNQFYGGRLVPLRQFGADRLDPLQVVQVEGAYTEGADDRLRNPVEAERIVETLATLFADPRYDRKTFGVITLQGGTGQIRVLERLISERIDIAEVEKRRLRVGGPPDFQGDQRDVVLLSLVVANPPRIAGSRDQRRRFNVAASRARDQLWLFTSVPAHRLDPRDLRHSLLTWMLDPAVVDPHQIGLDDVRPDQRHQSFDSLFEQRVFLRIRDRGYHVIPQVPVGGGKRIDLVVSGAKSRLGVECDGRRWHSTPEQVRADIVREQELRRAGWELWRLREGDFSLDPETALEPLWRELDRRGIQPGAWRTTSPRPSDWLPLDHEEGEGDHGAP